MRGFAMVDESGTASGGLLTSQKGIKESRGFFQTESAARSCKNPPSVSRSVFRSVFIACSETAWSQQLIRKLCEDSWDIYVGVETEEQAASLLGFCESAHAVYLNTTSMSQIEHAMLQVYNALQGRPLNLFIANTSQRLRKSHLGEVQGLECIESQKALEDTKNLIMAFDPLLQKGSQVLSVYCNGTNTEQADLDHPINVFTSEPLLSLGDAEFILDSQAESVQHNNFCRNASFAPAMDQLDAYYAIHEECLQKNIKHTLIALDFLNPVIETKQDMRNTQADRDAVIFKSVKKAMESPKEGMFYVVDIEHKHIQEYSTHEGVQNYFDVDCPAGVAGESGKQILGKLTDLKPEPLCLLS